MATSEVQEVVYAVSHDLQAPTRHIRAFLEVLVSHLGDELNDEAKGYIDRVVAAADSLQEMLEALTEYSRVITRGVEPGACESAAALDEALHLLRERIEASGAVVEVGPLPTIVADHAQLVTVFGEIIENSLTYCDKNPTVTISCESSGAHHEFRIEDTGPGFRDTADQAAFRLFKRFHPIGTSGSGIGLAVVKRVLDRHGGQVELESTPDGTIVRFTLPVSPGGQGTGGADEGGSERS